MLAWIFEWEGTTWLIQLYFNPFSEVKVGVGALLCAF